MHRSRLVSPRWRGERLDGGTAVGRYRVDLGPDPATGKRRQQLRQGFRTKREAEAALEKVLAAVREGTVTTRSSMTVGEYLGEWIAGQRQRLRATTLESYEIAVNRITQRLGHVKLQALAPLQLERFYTDLAEDGGRTGRPLAAKTIRNTHVVLRKALADAERLGLVSRNVAMAAKPPIARRPEYATWSSDDVRDFFAAVRGERLFPAFVLLATTGMRRGEVLGLRWRTSTSMAANSLWCRPSQPSTTSRSCRHRRRLAAAG